MELRQWRRTEYFRIRTSLPLATAAAAAATSQSGCYVFIRERLRRVINTTPASSLCSIYYFIFHTSSRDPCIVYSQLEDCVEPTEPVYDGHPSAGRRSNWSTLLYDLIINLCGTEYSIVACCPVIGEVGSVKCWCFTALSAQIGYIVPWTYEIYCTGPGTNTQSNIKTKSTKKTQNWASVWFCGDNLLH